MKKTCKAITNKDSQCRKSPYLFGYCKQHLKLKKRAIWFGVIGLCSYLLLDLVIPYVFEKSVAHFDGSDQINFINDFNCETEKLIQAPLFDNDVFTQSLYITIANSKKGPFSLGIGEGSCILPNTEYCVLYKDDLGGCNITMKVDPQGQILLNADLYDVSGLAIGIIRDNHLRLNEDCHFMFNYDENAIEIVDNLLNVVFSLERVEYNRLLLRGIYKYGSTYLKMNGSDTMLKGDKDYLNTDDFNVPRLFKYTGEKWRGVRKSL